MTFAMVAGGIPGGYLQEENDRVKRMLGEQEFETLRRQGPLRDDLLRAQAQHLRMAGTQSAQRLADERAANALFWNALNQPGSPLGNAPQPPGMGQPMAPPPGPAGPPPQMLQANPIGAGPQGQTPFMGVSMPQGAQATPFGGMMPSSGQPMQLPQQPAPQSMVSSAVGQYGPPQGDPLGGAPQPPQQPAAPMDPYTQAYQQGIEDIKRRLAMSGGTPQQKGMVAMIMEERLRNQIALQRQGDLERRQATLLEARLKSQEALENYRVEQQRLAGQRVEETGRHNLAQEQARTAGSEAAGDRADLHARVSMADSVIRARSQWKPMKPEEEAQVYQMFGVHPDQLGGQQEAVQTVKNPVAGMSKGDQDKLKAAIQAQIKAKGPDAIKGDGFVVDFNGNRFRVYEGEDGGIHFDRE